MTSDPIDYSPRGLVTAAVQTARDPRTAAARVMQERLPAPVLWMMLVAVVAASVVIGQGSMIFATSGAMLDNPYLANPLAMCVIQLGLLVVTVFAIHHIGRAMGGQGVFEDTLALIVWLQFVMACLQLVQTALMFLSPPLSDVVGIFGLVLFLWLLTHFVAAAHGFRSLGGVFMMIMASTFAITFLLSLVLAMLGIAAPGDFNV